MSKLRIGVIGGGKFGEMHLKSFSQLQHDGKVELVALADLNEDLLHQREKEFNLKGYTDYKKMISENQLDGVSIATPDHLHKQVTIDALNLGAHVLVEKPLDVTITGCNEMQAAADKNSKLLQVDFHKRFDPSSIYAYRLIRDNKIGNVLYAQANMEDKIEVPSVWFKNWVHNSSPFWFLGIHMVDLLLWLVGEKAVKVFATGIKEKLKNMGFDTYDTIQAQIITEQNHTLYVSTNWVLPQQFESIVDQGIKIVGTDGVLEIDQQDRGIRHALSGEVGTTTANPYFYNETKRVDGSYNYSGYGIASIHDFVDNLLFLQQGGPLADLEGRYASAKDGLAATAVAQAVHKSLETQQIQEVMYES